MIKKYIFRLLLLSIVLAVVAAAGGGFWLYRQIVEEPGEEIELAYIQRILGRESHVFYRDGTTPLGVFFDTSHRQYISFDEIPEDFVNALVASEDSVFFDHWGFDPASIIRATIKNIKAGRIVQGGSTLTQQTAKNLFKREERSFTAKFKELLMALKLEYYYSKEQIFEFYANQFYVSGNGVGLGVAARYYFDKTPAELDLVECAFIAGSVNRPNYYNPFRKKNEQGRELALQRAQNRLGYVLKEMWELGMIDQATYEKARKTPIPFHQGKVGYSFDYVMEMVKEAVSSDQVLTALAEHNIDNIATSGVRIITNIDQFLQRKTLAALRHRLGMVDVMLRGYNRDEVQQELSSLDYGRADPLTEDAFLFGTITGIIHKKKGLRIDVQLDNNAGQGYITADGLENITSAWVKYQRNNRHAELGKGDIDQFVRQLRPGDRIWAQVIRISADESGDNTPPSIELRLVRYPQVQGGAVVVREGRLLAVAGGTENRFFNRAVAARRTMGSAFKPLVYAAAIQLGWNSADLLYNARASYDYQGQIYFPRPDHYNPNFWVSMNWAGVRSENLATIWLLSRLCDKLTPLQFREVAQQVGLAPRKEGGTDESYQAYRSRLRDEVGIQMSKSRLQEAAYHMALAALEADFIFAGMEDELRHFSSLPYGARFPFYEKQIDRQLERERSARQRSELGERKQMLQKSFIKLQEAYPLYLEQKKKVMEELGRFVFFTAHRPVFAPIYQSLTDGSFHFLPFGGDVSGMIPFSGKVLIDHLQRLDDRAQRRFWDNIRLNGGVTVQAFRMVATQMEKEYATLLSRRPYEFDILQNIDEFRIAVGLHYLVKFGRKLGIRSALEPVLSFPLGSNVVTPFELTRAYEALVTGSLVTFGGFEQDEAGAAEDVDLLAVIDRIESAEGELLYTPRATTVQVADRESRLEINSILENVIRFGTGRYAHQHVHFRQKEEMGPTEGAVVTLLGKTGTANNYTNSSFFGFVPVADESGNAMTLTGGYAVGAYCGYDDNREMKHGKVRVSGSNGALPLWSEIADTIITREELAGQFQPAAEQSSAFFLREEPLPDQVSLEVDRERGGIPFPAASFPGEKSVARIRTVGRTNSAGLFIAKRHFAPFWSHGEESPAEGEQKVEEREDIQYQ